MTKNKFFKVGLALPLTALMLSGCTLSFNTGANSGSSGVNDGGVFKSLNKGATWQQMASIQGVNTKRSFISVDIISLGLDPGDNKAIYAGSIESGLFYSYDGAEGWQIATGLGKVSVTGVAVDPADKCVIYATASNKVFKSEDCNRTWTQVYFDNDLKAIVSSLVIDHANSSNIFIGTSNGDIIKSSDFGVSWRALNRVDSRVEKIVISPVSSKIMFAGTAARGIFRSLNGGDAWEKLADKLKDFDGSNRFRDLVIVKSEKATVFFASDYGLLKSTDDGDTWSKIELLTAEEEARIYSIAVDPTNVDQIYYATATTFYRSSDGGKNWISKKLPTSRAGVELLLDSKNPATLYLAARKITK